MGQYRPGPSMVTTVTRVFVSPAPATIAYLGLGRGWWVPLLGPLNPANMALGCGFFDMVLIYSCQRNFAKFHSAQRKDPFRAFSYLNMSTSA